MKGDLPFPWRRDYFTAAADRSLNKTTARDSEDKRTAKVFVKIMSAGGLKTISESPVDSLRDSDQFSIKVTRIWKRVEWKILFSFITRPRG